jgi:hypothetical protein
MGVTGCAKGSTQNPFFAGTRALRRAAEWLVARQAPDPAGLGFIHIFEERCIAQSFCFRFAGDGRFIARPRPKNPNLDPI